MELTNFYYAFHDKLDEFSGDYGWNYTAKCRHPAFHATVTICERHEFGQVFEKLIDNFYTIKGHITALEVYENPIKFISRYELM